VLGLFACSCGDGRSGEVATACCTDFLQALPQAQIRPADQPAVVRVVDAHLNGEVKRSLSASVPSRVVFTLQIPGAAVFAASLGVDASGSHSDDEGVTFRLGISDGRTYEQLLDRSILARDGEEWVPARVDLARYAGWQWSLFYHPSSITWQIVLNTYSAGSGAEHLRGLWATPRIEGRK
jgi:hypothetical protein